MQPRLDAYKTGSTLVFGHRGAMAYAPMNTLRAFELAYEQGADGIELDVHRTADGEVVIVHDYDVDKTTDGTGLTKDMSLSQLKELDAGSWFAPEFKGTRIPTLDETFEAVGNKLLINIEIKSIPPQNDGIEQLVAKKIIKHGLQNRILVSSFNPEAIQRFRQFLPEVPVGFLYESDDRNAIESMVANIAVDAHHPHFSLINAEYMKWARSNDIIINTWTVNDIAGAKRLSKLGVNTIITNTPDKIISAIRD